MEGFFKAGMDRVVTTEALVQDGLDSFALLQKSGGNP